MAQRDSRQRDEYRKAQERKKRRTQSGASGRKGHASESSVRHTSGSRKSSGRSSRSPRHESLMSGYDEYPSRRSASHGSRHGSAGKGGRKAAHNKVSRNAGLALAAVQGIASIVFMTALFLLDMLPGTFFAIIGVLLFIFFGVILASQFFSKKNAVTGKVLSVLISILLIVGSYFLFKANSAVGKISGGDYKLDNMVVAVLAEDGAESIEDAENYSFGVQYQMKGEQVEEAVDAINEELGTDIETVEFESLSEQAEALQSGEVDAIIYNEGYTGILEEAYEGYSGSTKVIYTYSIRSAVENLAADVSVTDDTFSVYISGIDVYGDIQTNSRSDVNIIATVNPKTHQILLVTTPRDYYVEIPGISGSQKDKLTHAGIYGVDASMGTLEQLYDTDIDFYARVNFTSLIEIVDALGGVDVDSDYAFTATLEDGTVVNINEGSNHLNGKQALGFSRERYSLPGGDNDRGKNQQKVITAIIRKMISPAILMGANGIIESVSGNVETNMSSDQIQDLIKQQISDGASWNIQSMAASGSNDSQPCYSSGSLMLYVMQPDTVSVDAIKNAIKSVENGETLEAAETIQQ